MAKTSAAVISTNGSEEFDTKEYQLRMTHVGKIAYAAFNRTPVNDVIDKYLASLEPLVERGKKRPIYGTFGDPTKFKGFGTYRGYKRHEQRYIHFESSEVSNGYQLDGDPALKERLKVGWTRDPKYTQVPEEVGVYITPGVAGALRHISDALILPPALPDVNRLSDIAKMISDNRLENGELHLSKNDADVLEKIQRSMIKSLTPDNVIIPMWTYVSHIAEAYRAHGKVKLCDIRNEDGQVNLDDLRKKIDPNTKAIIFATVGNPLSIAMEPEAFDSILDIARQKMREFGKPIVVIADTIYETFRRNQDKRIDPIQRALRGGFDGPVIETSSFSKMMAAPGARVGFFRYWWNERLFPDYRHDFLRALELLYWPTLCSVANQPQAALGSLLNSINGKDPVEEELAPLAAMLTALQHMTDTKGAHIKTTYFSIHDIMRKMEEIGIEEDFYSSSIVSTEARRIANKQLQGYSVDIDHEMADKLADMAESAGIVSVINRGGNKCLKLNERVPQVEKGKNGQLKLFRISSESAWRQIADRCGVLREDEAYAQHKGYMREEPHRRVMYWANNMKRIPGVYIHPACMTDGEPNPDRFNALYGMWGLEPFKKYNPNIFQATIIARMCVQNRQRIIANVPGELFLPPEVRPFQDSYNRHVALLTDEEHDEMFHIIRMLTRELGIGPMFYAIPGGKDRQTSLSFESEPLVSDASEAQKPSNEAASTISQHLESLLGHISSAKDKPDAEKFNSLLQQAQRDVSETIELTAQSSLLEDRSEAIIEKLNTVKASLESSGNEEGVARAQSLFDATRTIGEIKDLIESLPSE